jgi:hypothetical protein
MTKIDISGGGGGGGGGGGRRYIISIVTASLNNPVKKKLTLEGRLSPKIMKAILPGIQTESKTIDMHLLSEVIYLGFA